MTNFSQIENASTLYQQGRAAMDRNDLDLAITLFERSADLDPHFKTLELLGECLILQNRHREAIIPLAASVGLGTDPRKSMFLLAKVYLALGERDRAIQWLDPLISKHPGYKSAVELRKGLV